MGNPAGVRGDFEALEKRRFEAMGLVEKGLSHSETAGRVKVARQTVVRWAGQYRDQGQEAWKRAGRSYAQGVCFRSDLRGGSELEVDKRNAQLEDAEKL